MSVDTEVWTTRSGSLADLGLGAGWVDEGDAFVKEGDGWLLTTMEPTEAEGAEAPPEIHGAAPGICYRVGISLEPAGAPPDGAAELTAVVDAIGSAWGGAAIDPMDGRVRTWE